MFIVHQVCRSDLEDDGGLGGGGYFGDPRPVKTFSSHKKATAYLATVVDKKEWRVKWSIKKLEVT